MHIDTDQTTECVLARRLANLAADRAAQAPRTKALAIAEAKLSGFAEGAHILGYGLTPFAVELAAIEWVRADPRPDDLSAFQKDRKAWTFRVETDLAVKLVDMLREGKWK